MGHVTALATHEPDKIQSATQSADDLKDQAEAFGLETEAWWEEGEE